MKGIKLLYGLMMLTGMSLTSLAQADDHMGEFARSDHDHDGFARSDHDRDGFARSDHDRGRGRVNGFIRPDRDRRHVDGFARHRERNHIFLFIEPYRRPYSPPVVIIKVEPPVYIEQGSAQPETRQEAATTQERNYWYHCDKPEGYYPDINECPGGWQKVNPPLQP